VRGGLGFYNWFAPKTFGLGLKWGLYAEYDFATRAALSSDNREYSYKVERIAGYIPFQLIYKIDFSPNAGAFIYGGVGFGFGIKEKIEATYSNQTTPFFEKNESDISSTLNRFNIFTSYGCGVQLFNVIISANLSEKIYNPTETFSSRQKQGFSVNLQLMF
jgi:hypothetical protein